MNDKGFNKKIKPRITLPTVLAILLAIFLVWWILNYVRSSDKNEFWISPYPYGKDFAFSIIDDPDNSTGPDIKPVYDLLYQLGFRTTRTVWVFDQKHTNTPRREMERDWTGVDEGYSLENKDYLHFIKELDRRGFEIALHGVSAGNDYREEIIEGYENFKKIFGSYPKMDVLHSKNIENIYSGRHKLDNIFFKVLQRVIHDSDYQGHIPGSDYFWGDISQNVVRYVWLPFRTIKEINLLKVSPKLPFHDPRRPYVNYWFLTSDGSNLGDFLILTSPENMGRLMRERGTSIVSTHFAYGFTKQTKGKYVLNKDFVERMKYISKLDGYFAPTSEILDRFLALKNLFILPTGDKISIVNTGNKKVNGITIMCNPGTTLYDAENNPYHANNQGELIIDELHPNSNVDLYRKKLTEFNSFHKRVNIGLLARMKIEILNYIGYIRDNFE